MTDSTPHSPPNPSAPVGHEPSTINVRTIVFFAVSLALMVGVVQIVIAVTMNWISHDEAVVDEQYPERHSTDIGRFPTPRPQVDPVQELADIKRQELERLQSYGWVDQPAGIAHIPIDRALEILATKGLPKIPAPALKPGEAAPIGVSPLPVSAEKGTRP